MENIQKNWMVLAAALVLVGIDAVGQRIEQGTTRFRWEHFYRGLDFLLAALGAQLAYLTLNKEIRPTTLAVDDYVKSVNIAALFFAATFLTFLVVAVVHSNQRKRRNRHPRGNVPRREMIRDRAIAIITNFCGLLLLFSFVALVGEPA